MRADQQRGACAALSDACLNFTGAERSACYAVQDCITDSNCADGSSTLTSCFCGALATGQCIAAPDTGPNAPKGACVDVIRSAMAISGVPPTNAQVLGNYIDESFAAGAAIARYNCDKADPSCIHVCGF